MLEINCDHPVTWILLDMFSGPMDGGRYSWTSLFLFMYWYLFHILRSRSFLLTFFCEKLVMTLPLYVPTAALCPDEPVPAS